MPRATDGHCPHCGGPSRGTGGTACWRCQGFFRRNGCYPKEPVAPRLTPRDRLREAALAYADVDSEDDLEFARAAALLDSASLARAAELGWQPPRQRRRRSAPTLGSLPLLEWARASARCSPRPKAVRTGL